MATITLKDINGQIKSNERFIQAIHSENFEENLKVLNINWSNGEVNSQSPLFQIFKDYGYAREDGSALNSTGLLLAARISIDFEDQIFKKGKLDNKYEVTKVISIGKNSCTFQAKHSILGKHFVLKFLRPGAAENIVESLKLISGNDSVANLVQPNDYFQTSILDVFGNLVNIECIVYPYINGVSLREFLDNETKPVNAYAIAAFIRQISLVLHYLEKKGAYHGDLHGENIIVNVTDSGDLQFNVIDVSFGVTGSLSANICSDNDKLFFRQHVWNFLSAQQKYLTKMSIRKYLGAKIFHIVNEVMLNEELTFGEIFSLFNHNIEFDNYMREKARFLREKFSPPGSFKLQRYEEITDQAVALRLFVPFPELMNRTKSFSNIVLTGTRGTGKSTYLAAIAYFPKVENTHIDFREIFGVYFPCRQGEFRLLSSDMIDYNKVGYARVKHVIIVKIIRRTLEAIADGIDSRKLTEPESYQNLIETLQVFIGDSDVLSLDKSVVSEIRNIVSTMIRIEMKVIDNLFGNKANHVNSIATEINVIKFFQAIKESFVELSHTRFHLLFDDAGTPNIPVQVQHIINDITISSNPVYCVKLSTEKNSYQFVSTNQKELENGQDYFEYDINAIFYTGSKTFGLDDRKLEDYFSKILSERLSHFNYQSSNILEYLGDDFIKLENLVNSLATGKRNAYYSGWSMVWRIASGNPRNLLELVSEIFSVANVNEKSIPAIIDLRNQDRAIRSVSEKRLRSIAQISGAIEINKKQNSLGRKLFDVTLAIGSIFRIYLQSEIGKERKNQYLAIERNELTELNENADHILKELIKYGILDDSRLDFARDDKVKKPIYILNRIYCPVFNISYRRDQHLRLSKGKFEQLLVNPSGFITGGTRKLIDYNQKFGYQKNLFDRLQDES